MTEIVDVTEAILLDIRDELRGMRAEQVQTNERLGRLEREQIQTNERLGRVEHEQIQTNERLGRVEFVLEANTAQVTMLSAAVTAGMQSRRRVEDAVAALTERVERLEQR